MLQSLSANIHKRCQKEEEYGHFREQKDGQFDGRDPMR